MSKTKIQWATDSWSPVTGCTPITEGCANCYAARMAKRLAGRAGYPKDDPFKVTLRPDRLEQPLRWRKARRVFVCSMGDLFHKDVPFGFIDRVMGVISLAPRHTFMVLTKRPERMREYFESRGVDQICEAIEESLGSDLAHRFQRDWPLLNLQLGVSVENHRRARERIPHLLQTPGVRFVSIEPMLGWVDLYQWLPRQGWPKALDGVILGAESGPGARPMKIKWARDIKNQCVEVGLPFFYKQGPGDDGQWAKMPVLDGRVWGQLPERRAKDE